MPSAFRSSFSDRRGGSARACGDRPSRLVLSWPMRPRRSCQVSRLADEGWLVQGTVAVPGILKAARATIGSNSARRYLLARAPTEPRRRPVTPTSSTLAEIEAAIAHDEATLAGYRSSLARREAKGHDAAQARELMRTVERRLAMLRERRQIAKATEGPGEDGKGRRP